MPVLLVGGEVDRVAGPNRLDWAALGLGAALTLGDVEDLAVGVAVPGRAGAGGEVKRSGGGRVRWAPRRRQSRRARPRL